MKNYNQILFVDFGLCFIPEMSFSHPCLLLSRDNNLCKVVPITSNQNTYKIAYHPTDNPNGLFNYYMIPVGQCSLSEESSIIINQIRTISESRIIKILDVNGLPNTMYKDIRRRIFKDVFDDYEYQLTYLQNKKNIE